MAEITAARSALDWQFCRHAYAMPPMSLVTSITYARAPRDTYDYQCHRSLRYGSPARQLPACFTNNTSNTGAGEAFDAVSVQWVHSSAKLPSLKQRILSAGMLTTRQLGELLGVKRTTISRWRKQGLVEGRICNELGEFLYWPPKELPPRPQPMTATLATPRTA